MEFLFGVQKLEVENCKHRFFRFLFSPGPFPIFPVSVPLPVQPFHVALAHCTLSCHYFPGCTGMQLLSPCGEDAELFPVALGQSLCHWCSPHGCKVPPITCSDSQVHSIRRASEPLRGPGELQIIAFSQRVSTARLQR